MKNKKLYAAAMAAVLAVSAFGSTVMAAETTATGETKFEYRPGGVGPIDPVTPGDEETSVNNWMVYLPKIITLTDNNVETANTFTKGTNVTFTVKQKQPGADGDDTIKEANIPSGVTVEATVPNAEGDFSLTGTSGGATMQLAGFDGNTKLTQDANELGILTADGGDTQSGKAKISDKAAAVDGQTYSTTVTFTFTNPGV